MSQDHDFTPPVEFDFNSKLRSIVAEWGCMHTACVDLVERILCDENTISISCTDFVPGEGRSEFTIQVISNTGRQSHEFTFPNRIIVATMSWIENPEVRRKLPTWQECGPHQDEAVDIDDEDVRAEGRMD